MIRIAAIALFLLVFPVLAGRASAQESADEQAQSASADTLQPMTKEDVIALSNAGVSDEVIISQMIASGSYFQLNTDDIIDLEKAGVGEKVISAMVHSGQSPALVGGPEPPYYYSPLAPLVVFGVHPHFYYGPRLYRPHYGPPGRYRSFTPRRSGRTRSFGRHR